jgi:soluble lytic murein transglycosylase-like protein
VTDVGVSKPYPDPPGVLKAQQLKAAGFSDTEVQSWATTQSQKLAAGGFKPSEIDAYWGNGVPHNAALANYAKTNYNIAAAADPKIAMSPGDAFMAGWDRSVTGLIINRKAPDRVTPENAGLVSQVMNGVGQFAGDAPASIAGFFGGAAAGGAAGGAGAAPTGEAAAPVTVPVGAVVGAGFGMGATPEAARQILLDSYALRDGKIKTWQDATHVIAHSLWETTKEGITGAVTNFTGGKVAGKLEAAGASKLISAGGNATAQVIAGTSTGAALNGHIPDAKDFTTAAILTLGLHVAGGAKEAFAGNHDAAARVQHNMETLYRQTGVPPWEAAERAAHDPVFKQELQAQDPNGDPVTPQYRNAAPPDPAPFTDHGVMPEHQVPWLQPETMRNVTPSKGPFTPKSGAEPSPEAPATVTTANSPAHAKDLLRQLEGSGDQAISPAGAIGRYQIMPATARQYMGKDFDVKTLFDPAVNSAVADRIVADLFKRYNGDMNAIAIAYNAGPGRAGQYLARGPGTALVAIPDKTMRGGVRYEQTASRHDESFLPTETQHYLANERRKGGGGSGSGGGEGGPPPSEEPKVPSFSNEGSGGGAGGGGPPKPPAPIEGESPEDASRKFWSRQNDDTLTEEMLRNIGEAPNPTSKLLNLDRVLGQFVSELTPARRIDDRLIKAGEMDRARDLGAEDMFRQTYASDTRAGVFVRYGSIDAITLDIKPGSTSVMDAVKAVKDAGGNMDGWKAYMLAKRTADKAAQGVQTGFNPDAAGALAMSPKAIKKYQKATELFNDVMDEVLQYSRDSGVHSDAQIEAMKRDNPAYISMRRIMGDDDAFTGTGRGFAARDSLKKMEGSNRQIVDPIRATMDNMRLIIKMADRNRAVGHVIGMIERGEIENPGLLKIEDSQTIKAEGEAAFKPYGLPPEAGDTYAPLLAERAIKASGPNDFNFFRDGKVETWRASTPELADLMRKADGPGQANIVMKTFETFAKVERAGIVYSADFPVRNVLRDQITTFVNDPLHPPPFVTWLRGIAHVVGQTDTFKDAVAKGALGSSMVDMDINWLARDMDTIFHETGTWDGVANTVKHPLEFFQIIAEKLDAASRVGYMLHAQGKGVEPIKAATMSRKAYLDFAERGTAQVANQLSRIMPFFRPTLLGFKQFGEAMTERPASTLAYATAAISLPTIALYALNHLQDQFLPEDRKYANLPRWVKDNYFVTPEIGGSRIKLRYPQEAGTIFGGMVNRMLDTFVEHDKHAFDSWANGFLQNYLPPMMPPLAQVPIEVITNHSFFTGQPLIPGSMEKASGYMQYTPSTSETGKAVSRALGPPGLNVAGFSPIQFDQFVKGWTGAIGTGVLHALDIPYHAGKKPYEIADMPFVGSFFTRNPGMSAQPVQDFYNSMSDLEAKSADFALAMKRAEGGNASEIDQTAPSGQYASAIAPIKEAIALQSAAIQGVAANKDMTAVEKRQTIDALMPQLLDTAKQGVKAIDELKQAAKEADQSGPSIPTPPPAPGTGGAPGGRGEGVPEPPAVPLPGANRGQVPIA